MEDSGTDLINELIDFLGGVAGVPDFSLSGSLEALGEALLRTPTDDRP